MNSKKNYFKNEIEDEDTIKHLTRIQIESNQVPIINDGNPKNNIRIYIRIKDTFNSNIKSFIFENKKILFESDLLIKTYEEEDKEFKITIKNKDYKLNNIKDRYFLIESADISFVYLFILELNFNLDKNKKINPNYDEMKVIGHRGIGMNKMHDFKQYRENTVGAFIQALKMGIKWVELDVHVTNDNVPVIYHDFKKKSNKNCPKKLIVEMNEHEFYYFDDDLSKDNTYNVKTENWMHVSLENMLSTVPKNLCFNIEIKFPFSEEIHENNFKQIPKICEYVNSIYKMVNKYCRGNQVVFSSFHPEIMIYLSLIQNKFDLFFLFEHKILSQSSNSTMEEMALNFVKRYDFKGVVVDSELVYCRARTFIKNYHTENKMVFIYGQKTNIPNHISMFVENGIDGIITDQIELAKKTIK